MDRALHEECLKSTSVDLIDYTLFFAPVSCACSIMCSMHQVQTPSFDFSGGQKELRLWTLFGPKLILRSATDPILHYRGWDLAIHMCKAVVYVRLSEKPWKADCVDTCALSGPNQGLILFELDWTDLIQLKTLTFLAVCENTFIDSFFFTAKQAPMELRWMILFFVLVYLTILFVSWKWMLYVTQRVESRQLVDRVFFECDWRSHYYSSDKAACYTHSLAILCTQSLQTDPGSKNENIGVGVFWPMCHTHSFFFPFLNIYFGHEAENAMLFC